MDLAQCVNQSDTVYDAGSRDEALCVQQQLRDSIVLQLCSNRVRCCTSVVPPLGRSAHSLRVAFCLHIAHRQRIAQQTSP